MLIDKPVAHLVAQFASRRMLKLLTGQGNAAPNIMSMLFRVLPSPLPPQIVEPCAVFLALHLRLLKTSQPELNGSCMGEEATTRLPPVMSVNVVLEPLNTRWFF